MAAKAKKPMMILENIVKSAIDPETNLLQFLYSKKNQLRKDFPTLTQFRLFLFQNSTGFVSRFEKNYSCFAEKLIVQHHNFFSSGNVLQQT